MEGLGFVDGLPDELAAQQRLLRAVLRWCELDDDVRWLAVGCSVARGNADALSDLDLAIGVAPSEVDAAARRFVAAAGGFGELVECFDHVLASLARPHRRVFAQYADRTQLDVVLLDESDAALPGTIALYDPEGLVTAGTTAPAPSPAEVRAWACLAWEALANVGKYLRRGSRWEAHDALEMARRHAWQLSAVADGVPEPQYGLTSLLDRSGPPPLPEEMEPTVAAGLGAGDTLAASLRLARQLTQLQDRIDSSSRPMPEAFGRFVVADLESAAEVARRQGRC